METYDDLNNAPCDGPTQYPLEKLKSLLENFKSLYQ